MNTRLLLSAALLSGLGCAAAYADRAAAPAYNPRHAIAIAPVKVRAPYDVTVMSEAGESLETYARGGRYYVLGDAGDRYIIRVTNPTAQRVEAVITVDGLDVIDGENGDLKKRGYVVPAYGELRVEGFRTSTTDVATFRFSSVDSSYAGRKGKARNVGVIAVALFEEQAPVEEPQVIIGGTGYGGYYRDYDGRYDYGDDLAPSAGASRGGGGGGRGKAAAEAPRPAPPARDRSVDSVDEESGADYDYDAGPAPATASRAPGAGDMGGAVCCSTPTPRPAKKSRPGLGTEFGEQRHSAASYTRFVRAGNRPIAIAELRYNDASGLIALGIPLQPMPDADELTTRETADPFPGDNRFATPPR
jgi:hypothetical protein